MDNKDINLMHLKETKSSKKNGNTFGTLKGLKDFHAFGEYPIEALENKSLNEMAKMFIEHQKSVDERFSKVIEVLKYQKKQIKELERKLENYGL